MFSLIGVIFAFHPIFSFFFINSGKKNSHIFTFIFLYKINQTVSLVKWLPLPKSTDYLYWTITNLETHKTICTYIEYKLRMLEKVFDFDVLWKRVFWITSACWMNAYTNNHKLRVILSVSWPDSLKTSNALACLPIYNMQRLKNMHNYN